VDHAALAPTEQRLIGAWDQQGGTVVADETALRIDWLVRHQLERLSTDLSGGYTLMRDPRDGRLWELSYPEGEFHGGGPAKLEVIAPDAAQARYGRGTA